MQDNPRGNGRLKPPHLLKPHLFFAFALMITNLFLSFVFLRAEFIFQSNCLQMPSLQRVKTITTSSNDGKSEEKVISEVIEVANESSSADKPMEAPADVKPNTAEPTLTKTPKNGTKSKKNGVPSSQRKIGNFFTKAKPSEKKTTSSITATPVKFDSNNATKATVSAVPTASESRSETSTSLVHITSQVTVTPSTSAKKENSRNTEAGIDDDILKIVLGSHCSNSKGSPNITPSIKPRSKVRGVSVTSMLPSLVVQELQADSKAVNKPLETSRVDCSSVLENVGLSPKDKNVDCKSDTSVDQVNLLKPRSKKTPKKREAVTEIDMEGTLTNSADATSHSKANGSCSKVATMHKSDTSKEADVADAGSANSEPVKINTLAGRKKQKLKDNVPIQKEGSTLKVSTTTSNKSKSDSIDIQTSQNTQGAVDGEEKKSSDVTMKDSSLETEQVVELSEEDQALMKKFEKLSEKYISRAKELVQRSTDGSLEEESFQNDARHGKIIIPEVENSLPISSTNEVNDDWLNCISLLIQGRLVSYRLLCMKYYCFQSNTHSHITFVVAFQPSCYR